LRRRLSLFEWIFCLAFVVSLFFYRISFSPLVSFQVTSASGRMAPKRPATVTSSVFDDDGVSLMEMPSFPKAFYTAPGWSAALTSM
jgi:hypothetical protein